jgi:hypothetical protein
LGSIAVGGDAEIETFQTIPEFGDNGIWTADLRTALDRVS